MVRRPTRRAAVALLLLPVALWLVTTGADAAAPASSLDPATREANDRFGAAVDLDADTAVVGVPGRQQVGVYARQSDGWEEAGTIAPPAPAPSFGTAVALDGDTVVVGAPDAGTAHVFRRQGTAWTPVGVLAPVTPSPGFGAAVAVDGTTIAVGSPTAGAVDVFEEATPGVWRPVHRITGTGGLGTSVDLDGDLLAAGAPTRTEPPVVGGSVTVLHRDRRGTWRTDAELTPAVPAPVAEFGTSVALDGTTLAVGAPRDLITELTGAVHVFDRTFLGWGAGTRVAGGGGSVDERLGQDVALDGDLLVATASAADDTGAESGTLAVFRRIAGWEAVERVSLADAAAGDGLSTVALHGDEALLGAPLADRGATDTGAVGVAIALGVPAPPQDEATDDVPSIPATVDDTPLDDPGSATLEGASSRVDDGDDDSGERQDELALTDLGGEDDTSAALVRTATGDDRFAQQAGDAEQFVDAESPAARRPGSQRAIVSRRLPAPDDFSERLLDLAGSGLLALLLAALIPLPTTAVNNWLEAHADPIAARWQRFTDRFPRPEIVDRPVPLVLAGGAIAAALFTLLDPGASADRATAAQFAGLLAGIVVVTLVYEVTAGGFLQRHDLHPGRLRLFPSLIVIAGACVLLSRITGLEPGLVLGVVIAFEAAEHVDERLQGQALAWASSLLLVTALLAWGAWQPVADAAAAPDPTFWTLFADAALACVFVAGIESLVFGLLPLRHFDGQALRAWNPRVWFVLLSTGLFWLIHVVLHPWQSHLAGAVDTSASHLGYLLAALCVVAGILYLRRSAPAEPEVFGGQKVPISTNAAS